MDSSPTTDHQSYRSSQLILMCSSVPSNDHDFARGGNDDDNRNQTSSVASSSNSNNSGGNADLKLDQRTFPEHLMDIIEQETNDGYDVLEWASSGDSFVIRDKQRLETEVLPRHFNAKCKYMSFFRKLYRWGFRQLDKNSPDNNLVFFHKDFKRGEKKQCLQMRSTVKRPTTTVISRAATKNSGVEANQVVNLNNFHGVMNNLQGIGSGGIAGLTSFMPQQDACGFNSNSLNMSSFGGMGMGNNNQAQMNMMPNTQQQQQDFIMNQMNSLGSRGFDPSTFASQSNLPAPNLVNSFDNNHNSNQGQNNFDTGNRIANNTSVANNFSSMFSSSSNNNGNNKNNNAGNSFNHGGLSSVHFLQASLANLQSNNLQSQLNAIRAGGASNTLNLLMTQSSSQGNGNFGNPANGNGNFDSNNNSGNFNNNNNNNGGFH